MKNKQLWFWAYIVASIFFVGVLAELTTQRARDNSFAAFAHYPTLTDAAQRTLIEQQAIAVLGPLLAQPQSDTALALGALAVLRSSATWSALAPQIHHQLRAAMDIQYNNADHAMPLIKAIYALMEASDFPDKDAVTQRIRALAGDRSLFIADLQQAVVKLQMAVSQDDIQDAIKLTEQAWVALHASQQGQKMNWLAQDEPSFLAATTQAKTALERLVRKLLEPFGIPLEAQYGQAPPDQAMLGWLAQQAAAVVKNRAELQTQLRRAQRLSIKMSSFVTREPVVAVAVRLACQQQRFDWLSVLFLLSLITSLSGGFLYALSRLRRGPQPIDVNAETMENVEPIDLDTDAETRSRSSASITDVG
jgi:acyl transferase domain-containing protein